MTWEGGGNELGPGEVKLVKLVKVRVTRCRKGAERVPIGVRSIQGMKERIRWSIDIDVMLCNDSLIPPWGVKGDREWIHLMAPRLIGVTAVMAVVG